jgi:hypothetical protein
VLPFYVIHSPQLGPIPFPPLSLLFAIHTENVRRKSCICHSYENNRGGGQLFPKWESRTIHALFCIGVRLNSFLFSALRTLCKNTRGVPFTRKEDEPARCRAEARPLQRKKNGSEDPPLQKQERPPRKAAATWGAKRVGRCAGRRGWRFGRRALRRRRFPLEHSALCGF